MQKTSLKKLSILGLVLVAASAVTAAVVPNQISDKRDNANNGSLRQTLTSGGDWTCVANSPGTGVTCTVTDNSSVDTTGGGSGSSVTQVNGRDTLGNTSLTGIGGNDSQGGA